MTRPPSYHYAYPPSAPPPQPGPRPPGVTMAAMLLLLTVISNVGVGYTIIFDILGEPGDNNSDDLIAAILLGGSLVVMGLFIVLVALGLLRGRGAARVVAYIVSAVSLCGCGFLEFMLVGTTISGGADAPEQVVALMLGFLALIAYIAVVVLLSLPAAASWFREHRQLKAYGPR